MNVPDLTDIVHRHIGIPWDADDGMADDYVRGTPPGQLVAAYIASGLHGIEALRWLTLFAARRSLPCWRLYCDRAGPSDAVAAAQAWVKEGLRPERVEEFSVVARPAFRGVPIVDCRASDTGCAAAAAARLIRFLDSGDPLHAIYCISASDMAFDQSPLNREDHFREWFMEYAIPISAQRREMTESEQAALREYSVAEIDSTRDADSDYWNGSADSDASEDTRNADI